jgi:hypothetical protein
VPKAVVAAKSILSVSILLQAELFYDVLLYCIRSKQVGSRGDGALFLHHCTRQGG